MFRRKSALTFDPPSHFLVSCHGICGRWHLNGDTAPQGLSFVLLAEKNHLYQHCHTGVRHCDRIPSNTHHRAILSSDGATTYASQRPGSRSRPRGRQGTFLQTVVRAGPPLRTGTAEVPLLSQGPCGLSAQFLALGPSLLDSVLLRVMEVCTFPVPGTALQSQPGSLMGLGTQLPSKYLQTWSLQVFALSRWSPFSSILGGFVVVASRLTYLLIWAPSGIFMITALRY